MAHKEDIAFLISFVQEVESRPCLWNYSLKSYNKSDETSLAWKEVAKKLKDTEPNCRERWKNIRCAFVRSLRPPKSGSGSKAKKKYYLADYLSFLIPYLKGGATSGNLSISVEQDSEDDNPISVSSELQCEQIQDNYDLLNAISLENLSEHVPPVAEATEKPSQSQNPVKKKAKPNNDAETAFAEWLHSKKFKPQPREKDADLLFLESILPDLKQLDNQRRRHFKSDVLQLLNKALEERERQGPIFTPSSSSNTGDYWDTDYSNHQSPLIENISTVPINEDLITPKDNADILNL